MWQEARKQEKKLRGIMIDFKKRAERRQAYYAKMRTDPHQLMRIYGQKCKLHILTENSKVIDTDGQLVPWQGDPDVLIDRFDVRAHLDIIPEVNNANNNPEKSEEEEKLARKLSYECYRTLVQIDATGASEEQYLQQLTIEENYGKKIAQINEEKNKSKAKAKIHYQYKDSTTGGQSTEGEDSGSESDGELSDIDINVNVLELTDDQKNHLDGLSTQYGIGYGQYCRQLMLEKKEFEYVKRLQEEEEERSKMPGRKGKAARRDLRMKQRTMRGSPLSFALHTGQDDEGRSEDDSSNESDRSGSPNNNKIEFITEFGAEDPSKQTTESRHDKVKEKSHSKSSHKSPSKSRGHRSRSRDRDRRSRSRDRHNRKSYRSRSRERERRRSRSYSRERSSRHSRSKPRDHRSPTLSQSKSPSLSSSRSGKRTPSKSPAKASVAKALSTPNTASKTTVDKSKLSAREKMKLRMQKLLNKQIKHDKKEEEKKQIAKDMEEEERDVQRYEMSKVLKSRDRDRRFRRSPSPEHS